MAEVIQVPQRQWTGPAINFGDVQDAWSGAVDVVGWWVNLFGANQLAQDMQDSSKSACAKALAATNWTGTGALLWLRVMKVDHQDSPLVARGIIGDGPMFLALGQTPREALYAYLTSDRMIGNPPDGWVFDDAASHYIWVDSNHPNGTVIPKGAIRELTDEVKGKFSEMALAHAQAQFSSGEILTKIVDAAKKSLQDAQAAAKLEDILQTVKSSQARVRQIQEKLNDALEAASASQRAMMLLDTLKGVLSIAQLGEMVAAEMKVDASVFKNQPTLDSLVTFTQGKAAAAEDTRVHYLGAFNGSIEDYKTFLKLLQQQVYEYVPSAPPALDQYLKP
jgi:hypothetical protein